MKKGNRDSMFQRPKSEPSQEQEKNNKVNTWNFLEKTMHLEALFRQEVDTSFDERAQEERQVVPHFHHEGV